MYRYVQHVQQFYYANAYSTYHAYKCAMCYMPCIYAIFVHIYQLSIWHNIPVYICTYIQKYLLSTHSGYFTHSLRLNIADIVYYYYYWYYYYYTIFKKKFFFFYYFFHLSNSEREEMKTALLDVARQRRSIAVCA